MRTRRSHLCIVPLIAGVLAGDALCGNAAEPRTDSIRLVQPLPWRLPRHTCGVHSFIVCARSAGYRQLTVEGLQKELAPIGPQGVSMNRLEELAAEKHIPVRAVATRLEQLIEWDRPAILHVDQHHYIAFLGSNESGILVFDSRSGLLSCPVGRFAEAYEWEGNALVFGEPPPWWEHVLLWPNVGLVTLGALLLAIGTKLTWAVA